MSISCVLNGQRMGHYVMVSLWYESLLTWLTTLNFGVFLFCYPAGAAAGSCILLVSVHLVKNFLLSGNTSFSHTSLHPILTKLGQSDRYLNHYSCTNNDGVRGQDGVTGVKKVIFTKKASSPTEYLASMRDLCICISLTPSTKVMVLKIHPGSFGVTGVKRSFSPKRHQVLQNA